uniref:Uncharacterized protein n=1 Tax=Arundo donax TaxID=35708 RepID=A0A0A9FKM0_ARUDO
MGSKASNSFNSSRNCRYLTYIAILKH